MGWQACAVTLPRPRFASVLQKIKKRGCFSCTVQLCTVSASLMVQDSSAELQVGPSTPGEAHPKAGEDAATL